jgi:hypothetical protein
VDACTTTSCRNGRNRASASSDATRRSPSNRTSVLENGLGHAYPGMAWEPKAAFTALADRYRG